MARAPCWDSDYFTLRTLFVTERCTGNRRRRQIVERNIRSWISQHLRSPSLRLGHCAFLRKRIVADLRNSCISDDEILNCFDQILDRDWPSMVYRAGMVPVYHQPSGSMRAKTVEEAEHYIDHESGDYQQIPPNGTISGMAPDRKSSTPIFFRSEQYQSKDVPTTSSDSIQQWFPESETRSVNESPDERKTTKSPPCGCKDLQSVGASDERSSETSRDSRKRSIMKRLRGVMDRATLRTGRIAGEFPEFVFY